MIAALTVGGHLSEAVAKSEAVVSGLTSLVLDGMANGEDTSELEALLTLTDAVRRHVSIAIAA